jgi:hypothetical protein
MMPQACLFLCLGWVGLGGRKRHPASIDDPRGCPSRTSPAANDTAGHHTQKSSAWAGSAPHHVSAQARCNAAQNCCCEWARAGGNRTAGRTRGSSHSSQASTPSHEQCSERRWAGWGWASTQPETGVRRMQARAIGQASIRGAGRDMVRDCAKREARRRRCAEAPREREDCGIAARPGGWDSCVRARLWCVRAGGGEDARRLDRRCDRGRCERRGLLLLAQSEPPRRAA